MTDAEAELQRLLEEREKLDRRIWHLRRVVADTLPGATYRRHREPAGEFAGLWGRTAAKLRQSGVTTRVQLRELYARDGIRGLWRIHGLGRVMAGEVESWLAE